MGISFRINVEIFTHYLKGREISKFSDVPKLIRTEKAKGNNLQEYVAKLQELEGNDFIVVISEH